MENKLKISVVTVSYNAADTIEETIRSVVNQTYDNIEYIIIDGGSTDGTVDIIKKYADRITYWVSEPDKGIYDAMNKGIAVATGDYINFMNAGDTFADVNTIKVVSNIISDSKNSFDIYYGDTIYVYSYGEVMVPGLSLKTIEKRLPYCHQSSFVRISIHKTDLFNLGFRYCADYNFVYCGVKIKNYSVSHIPIIISRYEAEDGVSSKMFKSSWREKYKINNPRNNKLRLFKSELELRFVLFKTKIRELLPSKFSRSIQQYIRYLSKSN